MTVPEDPSDTATFGASNITEIAISSGVAVNEIVFDENASRFDISAAPFQLFAIRGAGIINHSGVVQKFIIPNDGTAGATMQFGKSASAGDLTLFESTGGLLQFTGSSSASSGTFVTNQLGFLEFFANATADHGTFVTNGSVTSGSFGGFIFFLGSSTAGSATIMIDGGAASGATEAAVDFSNSSTAADAIITIQGGRVADADGGLANFFDNASAGSASLAANGGVGGAGRIRFLEDAVGDTARIKVSGTGNLDISQHNAPGVTIGSLQGNGVVFLGSNNLSVGSNNLRTTFSGVIQDSGSLSKIGSGGMKLSGANTYAGGTVLSEGTLLVSNKDGSGTGSGLVQVKGGTLGGSGSIVGAVTIGTGNGSGAELAPSEGAKRPTALTIQDALTFKADGTYTYRLSTKKAQSDQVTANGVTIESGAQFNFQAIGNHRLQPGQVFTVINNTAATPIAGTFANLAEGASIQAGRNTFQASYSGGDGNDLTLSVLQEAH